jgi:hypothetical protein
MTNEETLEALANEYLTPANCPKDGFTLKDTFKAGFAARDSEVQGLKEKLNKLHDYTVLCEKDYISAKEQLASQAAKADKAILFIESLEPSVLAPGHRLLRHELIKSWRTP